MEIKLSKNGSTGNIHLSGRFDTGTHHRFKEAFTPYLRDPSVELIDIYLTDVSYIDSAALGMLLLLREHASNLKKTVGLRAPNENVQKILDIANFQKLFTIS
ncbi:MAG: STAS domain-containing protein [Gallionellaceae bacterium]